MAKSDKANEKTNVMRLLDQAGIAYTPRYYDASLASGTEVAAALGQSAECVFKTLVAEANTGEHFVFVIPAPETLSLKKAAKAAGVKSIAMLPQKKLLPLTGYVHGGCSPVGMKKTVFHMDRRNGAFDGRLFLQRRTARRADRDRSRSSGRLYRRAVRRSHRRINNRE